ncbi:MAG: hypothetical protein AAGA10_25640 [Bacteroidota bacterium]
MKKILITNLGNRNITYQGEFHQDLRKKNRDIGNFRTWTEGLWKNYDQEARHIQPEILHALIDDQETQIGRVIMFSSNQPANVRRDQDTYFEGKILLNWFQEKYPHIEFEHWEMDTLVIDNEALLRAYQEQILKMQKRYPDKKYILCEAGGTAQQKSSLKIMLEYLMEADDFEMYYVPQEREGVSGKPIKRENIQYRKVLDAIQIERQIKDLRYEAAMNLYAQDKKGKSDVSRLLLFGTLRSHQLHRELKGKIGQMNKRLKEWEMIRNYQVFDPGHYYQGWLQKIFPYPYPVFVITECLMLTQKYLSIGNFSEGVIKLQIFIETYLGEVLVQGHIPEYENKNYHQLKKALLYDFEQQRWENIIRWNEERFKSGQKELGKIDGNPIRILTARNIANPIHQQLLSDFCDIIYFFDEKGFDNNPATKIAIDTLRNGIAHKGIGVTEERFLKIPGIEEKLNRWYRYFHFAINPYDELNEKIVALLKEGR